MVAVTHVFAAGDTVSATYINEDFDDLEAALTNIGTAQIAEDAGIRATQLADRYAITPDNFEVISGSALYAPAATPGDHRLRLIEAGGVLGTDEYGTEVASAGAWVTARRQQVTLDSGQEGYLSEIEIHMVHAGVGNALGSVATIQFRVTLNGVVIGGSAVTLDTDNAYYRIRNSNPIDNPLIAIANDDELLFQLNAVTATDQIVGLRARCVYKTRINN